MKKPERIEARHIIVTRYPKRPDPDPVLDALYEQYPMYPYGAPPMRLEGASTYDPMPDKPTP